MVSLNAIINIWLSLIFLLFAVVQLNDDDYYIWVPIYLVPASLNTAFLFFDPTTRPKFGFFAKVAMFLHSQICIVMAIYLVLNKDWFGEEFEEGEKKTTGFVELLTDSAFEVERELGGLWICLYWVHHFWPSVQDRPERHHFVRKKT